jgi:ABC-type transport system substrate-binding protein
MLGANLSGSRVDDPDAYFFKRYACGPERNYTNYCNPELEKLYEQQPMERDQDKRKKLVWDIDRRLQEDAPADDLQLPARHVPISTGPRNYRDGQQSVEWLAL